MIYRIIGESPHPWWEENGPPHGTLRGAAFADLADFGDLPAPKVTNPRTRFWFTEEGWKEYGRDVLKQAMQSGRVFRLLQAKNPPRSAIVYQDKWQVALLPVKEKK
jgi:hypothetical protein